MTKEEEIGFHIAQAANVEAISKHLDAEGKMGRPKKIRHEGLHSYRLAPDQNNPREVAFAKQWCKENKGGANSSTLEWLLVRDKGNTIVPRSENIERLAPYDQQSASVAATVIQWLGSNVGWCFLQEALKRCGYRIVKIGGENEKK